VAEGFIPWFSWQWDDGQCAISLLCCLRQLLWHRHRLVQMRTRVMNQLHVVALNEGLRRKKALWRPAGRSELESLILAPWASRRRQDLLDLLDHLTPKIQGLTRALEEEVEKRPVTRRLTL